MNNKHIEIRTHNWIKQPNRITFSRYKCTEVQENFITLIMFSLQNHLTEKYDLKSNLFEQPIVEISLNQLADRRNHKYLYLEAVKMRTIGIDYFFRNEKEHLIQKNLGIIISVERNFNLQTLTFTLNKEAVVFLTYIGLSYVGKYTNYSLSIALKIRGVYSKRIYKLVSSWKNKGGFKISILDFKKILYLEDKYKNLAHLKRLLNSTKEKLKLNADLYYEFSIEKLKGKRKADIISFKIITLNPASLQKINSDKIASHYNIVRNLLNIWFPIIESSFTSDTSEKLLNNGNLEQALKRLKRMKIQYDNRLKSKQDCINNIRTNCLKDWDIIK